MTALIALDQVAKHYRLQRRRRSHAKAVVRAVDGVSLALAAGEALGVVGETGSGKSTLGRLVLGLETASSGRVLFEGADLARLDAGVRRLFRTSVQAVFQDPWGSLNPRMRIGSIVAEPLVIAGWPRERVRERVAELLRLVGLDPGQQRHYPHEFSGGQRQRIAIARALGPGPRLIVLDEPVSALDLSIRAQIVNLLNELREAHGFGYLMISHDLASVWVLSDRVAVMYLGEIVELAASEELRLRPLHPYTQALLASTPGIEKKRERHVLKGELPSPLDPPHGCAFHTRCPHATERCRAERPAFRPVAASRVACHYAEKFL